MRAFTFRPEISAIGTLMMSVEFGGKVIGTLIGSKRRTGETAWRPNGGRPRGSPTVWYDTKHEAAKALKAIMKK